VGLWDRSSGVGGHWARAHVCTCMCMCAHVCTGQDQVQCMSALPAEHPVLHLRSIAHSVGGCSTLWKGSLLCASVWDAPERRLDYSRRAQRLPRRLGLHKARCRLQCMQRASWRPQVMHGSYQPRTAQRSVG